MNPHARHIEKFSHGFAKWAGTSRAFVMAIILTLIWLLSGIFFAYSTNWEASFNSFTSIIMFLMLFVMQRANNKEALAIQVKLNELISTQKTANNSLINIEESTEQDIKDIQEYHRRVSQKG